VNLVEATEEVKRLNRLIDSGVEAMRDQAREYSEAENEYRKNKAQAWLQAPEGTVPERQAWVDGQCAKDRARRDLADGLRQAALEAVRSRRAQLDAIRSLLSAEKAEMELAR
jgi:hypothetical protein